jgi:hypothetical protein
MRDRSRLIAGGICVFVGVNLISFPFGILMTDISYGTGGFGALVALAMVTGLALIIAGCVILYIDHKSKSKYEY